MRWAKLRPAGVRTVKAAARRMMPAEASRQFFSLFITVLLKFFSPGWGPVGAAAVRREAR
jgi:hypothetical protein